MPVFPVNVDRAWLYLFAGVIITRAGREKMMDNKEIFAEVAGLYKIVPLKVLRRTPGVYFDLVPKVTLPHIDGLDRVLHEGGALSPGPVGEVARPWYMHLHQDDNLIVLHGSRYVDIYTPAHGQIESFVVTPHLVKHGNEILFDGPAMLVWPCHVFHRIRSADNGSASLNFAVRYEGFDLRTNFNIYDLNTTTGEYRLIREGYLDQITGDA